MALLATSMKPLYSPGSKVEPGLKGCTKASLSTSEELLAAPPCRVVRPRRKGGQTGAAGFTGEKPTNAHPGGTPVGVLYR
jgi:hypothetical protein